MIDRISANAYSLICDNCEDEADELLESFTDATQYGKENGWRSVKKENGEWANLCPFCKTPDIIKQFRGY